MELMCSGVLVSGVRQSGSAKHIPVPILFWNIKQSSLYHTVGACWLSILHVCVNPNLVYHFPHLPHFGNHTAAF